MPIDLEKKRASRRAYYRRHHERIRAEQKEYYGTPERRKQAVARAKKHHESVKGTPGHRYIQLKSQAKQRGLKLKIDLEEYTLLIQGNRCKYCGDVLPITGHGLDREDNRLEYVVGNVVPCCARCNARKGHLEYVGFRYPRTVELLLELINENPVPSQNASDISE